jgi:hypothetical protein
MTMRFWRADEGEPRAQLQDEALQLAEDGRFEVGFVVGVGQAEEVQNVRVAEDQVRRQLVLRAEGGQLALGKFGRLLRQGGTLEEHAANLGPQGPDAPALDAAHLGVEIALEVIWERNDL